MIEAKQSARMVPVITLRCCTNTSRRFGPEWWDRNDEYESFSTQARQRVISNLLLLNALIYLHQMYGFAYTAVAVKFDARDFHRCLEVRAMTSTQQNKKAPVFDSPLLANPDSWITLHFHRRQST